MIGFLGPDSPMPILVKYTNMRYRTYNFETMVGWISGANRMEKTLRRREGRDKEINFGDMRAALGIAAVHAGLLAAFVQRHRIMQHGRLALLRVALLRASGDPANGGQGVADSANRFRCLLSTTLGMLVAVASYHLSMWWNRLARFAGVIAGSI